MVTHLQASCGKDTLERVLLELGWENVPNWDGPFVHRRQGFLSVYVDEIEMAGRGQDLNPMWKKSMKLVDFGQPTSFLDHVYLGCTQTCMQTERKYH